MGLNFGVGQNFEWVFDALKILNTKGPVQAVNTKSTCNNIELKSSVN